MKDNNKLSRWIHACIQAYKCDFLLTYPLSHIKLQLIQRKHLPCFLKKKKKCRNIRFPYRRIFGLWNITRKRKIKSTPRRSIRAARASFFTEWQISKFSSVVIRASHTRPDIPGPKSGLTVLIHSPWLFLNSYLLFEWLISSAGNVYIRTVFHLTRFGLISKLSFNIVESIKR